MADLPKDLNPVLPEQGEKPPALPAQHEDLMSLLGDLTQNFSQINEAKLQIDMNRDQRQARIHAQLVNEQDAQVVAGRGLGRRLATAGDDDLIELSTEDLRQLGLTAASVSDLEARGINNGKVRGRELERLLQQRRSDIDGGTDDIFKPARASENGELIAEGNRRVQMEEAYVVATAALTERALQRAISQSDFTNAAALIQRTYGDLNDTPRWFSDKFSIAVMQASRKLEDKASLQAVAPLAGNRALTDAGGMLSQIAPDLQTARQKLEEILQREAEAARQKAEQEALERKQKRHTERTETLEDDTFQAAFEAGRNQFESLRRQQGVNLGNISVPIEGRLREDGQPDNFELVLGTIRADQRFQRAIDNIGRYRSTPEANLEALRILVEDPDLMESVVRTVAANRTADWTGYSRADYATEDEWISYWRQNIDRTVRGYAIGLAEGAVTGRLSDSELETWSKEENLRNFSNLQRNTFRTAIEVAFGEINIIDREQWGRMSPSQTRALLELGRFRQSLKADPVKSSESQILEGFLASTIAIDASNAVRGRIAEVKARILDQMKKQEELTQAIVTTRQSIDQTLTRLTDIREIGELAMVRVAWNEVRRLQEQPGEVSRWVIIDKSDKQNPRLSINEEARSLLQQAISKLEDEIGKLPPESERNPAQKEQYRKMQERLERGRIQMAFVKEVDANIRNMNESYNIGSEKRTLQGYVGFFRESGLPYMSGDYGRITDQTTSDELDKRINYIYGNDREQVGGLHKAYEQAVNDLGKDGLSEEERRRIAQNLETIVRNLSTCISHTESVRRQVNFSNVISYAAKRFIKEDLWQELIRLKLTQQKPDRF